jgi:N6-adenosine-specific RNA methylase IME4
MPNEQQPYRTILADPPWATLQTGTRDIHGQSRVTSMDALFQLSVRTLCTSDAHLWLWVNNTSLAAGLAVMETWGFSYGSCLTWIKPWYGLGRYLRNQTEHLLFGIRGNAPVLFRGQGTWFYAPVEEYSRKPEEQYAIIERCSPGRTWNCLPAGAVPTGMPGAVNPPPM